MSQQNKADTSGGLPWAQKVLSSNLGAPTSSNAGPTHPAGPATPSETPSKKDDEFAGHTPEPWYAGRSRAAEGRCRVIRPILALGILACWAWCAVTGWVERKIGGAQ